MRSLYYWPNLLPRNEDLACHLLHPADVGLAVVLYILQLVLGESDGHARYIYSYIAHEMLEEKDVVVFALFLFIFKQFLVLFDYLSLITLCMQVLILSILYITVGK